KLAALVKDRQKGDSLMVALSGHVIQFAGERECYYCPADADLMDPTTLLPLSDVFNMLDNCSAGTKVVFLECRQERSKNGAEVKKFNLGDPQPWTLRIPRSVSVYFSCFGGGKGFVRAEDGEWSGAFFAFVSLGLAGEADDNADQKVTLAELEK